MRRLGRVTLMSLAGILAVVVAGSAVAAVLYGPTYVTRVLTMRMSSQYDYLHNFPLRVLEASDTPFVFTPGAGEESVTSQLEAAFAIEDLDDFLETTGTQALIVIEADRIVLERYANGAARDTMLTSFSVAKSFDSALIGIAIDEGFISSVHDPVTDYLGELGQRDPRFRDITIEHLLRMSSGLGYEEMRWGLFNGDDPLTTYYPDQRRISLENTHIVDRPGVYFRYNKYHPQLLGMVLERATGMSVTEYMQTRLWDPLGMQYDGAWALDSAESGFEKMEAGLNARAIDYAKLGRLYLHDGSWDGTQVVSAEWVDQSLSADSTTAQASYYRGAGRWVYADGAGWYGYMWYARNRPGAKPDFFAEGDHGQFVYVSPSRDLVVVRNGTEWGVSGTEWIDGFFAFAGSR